MDNPDSSGGSIKSSDLQISGARHFGTASCPLGTSVYPLELTVASVTTGASVVSVEFVSVEFVVPESDWPEFEIVPEGFWQV